MRPDFATALKSIANHSETIFSSARTKPILVLNFFGLERLKEKDF
jgi:hypothetical protein